MLKMKTSNFYLYIETYNIIMTQFIITTIFTILNFIQKNQSTQQNFLPTKTFMDYNVTLIKDIYTLIMDIYI